MRRALIVIGKAPIAGQVKTRLTPPLTPRRAAQLYKAFLLDCIALADVVEGTDVYVLYAPRPRARGILRETLPSGVRLLAQKGKGIGEGSAYGFRYLLEKGYEQVVLIGSDNPSLPATYVQEAYAGLANADLVFGPTEDGGYYLIGMCKPHEGVFERITWSTERVEGEVRERAAELGLSVQDVPRWYDVDSVAELRRLTREVEETGGGLRYTRRVLKGWGAKGEIKGERY